MAAPDGSPPDPSLAALAPRRSRRRAAVVAGAFVAAMALTWLIEPYAMPRFEPTSWAGSSAATPDGMVMSSYRYEQDRPDVWLVAIGEVPGARLIDVWSVDCSEPRASGAEEPVQECGSLSVAAGPDDDWRQVWLEAHQADLPHLDPAQVTLVDLPFRVGSGQPLIMVWQITDCAALPAPDAPVQAATIRSALGVTAITTIPAAGLTHGDSCD